MHPILSNVKKKKG